LIKIENRKVEEGTPKISKQKKEKKKRKKKKSPFLRVIKLY
jgi:hypothetical protein